MLSYQELMQQRATLELQIKQARERELGDAIAKVKELVTNFNLTAKDVFPHKNNKRGTEGNRVQPKYRNPATGDTWTGRGKAPKWIQNSKRELFLITK
ncbi:MAG: H-NS histone family protein [Ottowia sp.]|nr:H-NS histone family protein [Ottowia sp.]